MVEFLEETNGNLLAVRITGKVDKQNFERFDPVLDTMLEKQEDPRFYMELLDMDTVTPRAIFEDLKNLPKYNQFTKVAVVGDAKWKELVTKALGAMMKPSAKFFETDQKKEALEWVRA
jgi:hypothetical protein